MRVSIAILISLSMLTACSKKSNPNAHAVTGDTPVTFMFSFNPELFVPPAFTGLSFETSSLTNAGYFNAANTVFVNLVKGLGTGIIRIGGNSADKTGWTGSPRTASTATDSLTTTDIDRFFGFAAATGWKVMFALNLGTGTASAAANEAAYIYQHYSDQLLCFEIGNEPDLYSQNGLRPKTYTYAAFKQEFQGYHDTIKAAVPNALFSGPATASHTSTWVANFSADESSNVRWFTEHYYKMGPPTDTSVTIPNLLKTDPNLLDEVDQLSSFAFQAAIGTRISECNSVYDGGAAGVSNTLASALWSVDFMLNTAGQGNYNRPPIGGVNFHGGGNGIYTPIAFSNGQFTARPLYYGMLLFAQLQKQVPDADFLPIQSYPAPIDCIGYAFLGVGGSSTMAVVLINKNPTQNDFVTLTRGQRLNFNSATVLRLSGSALNATSGITLGGAAVDENGNWTAGPVENAALTDDGCTLRMPAGSAALVIFK